MPLGTYQPEPRTSQRALGAHEIDWQNPSDDEVVDFVRNQCRAGSDRRRPWVGEAMENLAYLGGEQDVEFAGVTSDLAQRILDAEVPPEWDQPIQVNTLKNFVLQRMGFLIGVPVTWFVQPRSGDDDDVASARVGQKLLQHQWAGGDRGFNERVLEALWIMFATGVVFAYITWDPTAGERETYHPPRPQEGEDDETSGRRWLKAIARRLGKRPDDVRLDEKGGYSAAEGNVHVEFATGAEITEPVHCHSIREADWIIFSRLRTLERLRERYGSVADTLTPDRDSDAFTTGWRALYGDFAEYSDGASAQEAPADHVLVHELWRPHSARYPKGYRAVVADDTLLKKGPHPYRHGRIPFGAMKELPERRFRPHCTVRMLLNMQTARNEVNSKIARHVNKVVDPHILAEEGADVPDDFLQRGPSQVTRIPNGYVDRIKPLVMPALPHSVWEFDQRLRDNMMEVAGVHDSSLGRSESAQQSGRHAALLQQSDARGNSVTRELIEGGFSEVGEQSLWLYYQYVRRERLLVLTGGAYAYEVVRFKGEQLHRRGRVPGPTSFNVKVSIGSEPDLQALLEKIKLEVDVGLLDPVNREADRLRIQKMLGEASTEEFDDGATHRSNAAREHELFLKGEPPMVARGDADAIHIREHEEWTTTEEFRAARRNKPRLAILVENHLREHLFQMAEKEIRPKFMAEVVEANLRVEYAERLGRAGQSEPAPVGPRMAGAAQGGLAELTPAPTPALAESPGLMRFSA